MNSTINDPLVTLKIIAYIKNSYHILLAKIFTFFMSHFYEKIWVS